MTEISPPIPNGREACNVEELKHMFKKAGRYCKAYLIQDLRRFDQWAPNHQNARFRRELLDGEIVEIQNKLTDDHYLFLQEDYTVTDSIFLNDHVIFDKITSQWIEYCQFVLKFEPPQADVTNN